MVTKEMILEAAATEFGTTVKRIVGRYKVRPLPEARAYCAVWMRVSLRMSYSAIGRALGGIDHTSVMYLCGKLPGRTPFWLRTGEA